MKRIAISLTLLTAIICQAQTSPATMLKSSDLLSDTVILRNAYE
jgi:hypothetical protein